jgi:hypothetical protein
MEHQELWRLVEADLKQARNTLPGNAASDQIIQLYEEFLAHNELELACDMLEEYAKDHAAGAEFWLALRDAAIKMQLLDRASRYEGYAQALSENKEQA